MHWKFWLKNLVHVCVLFCIILGCRIDLPNPGEEEDEELVQVEGNLSTGDEIESMRSLARNVAQVPVRMLARDGDELAVAITDEEGVYRFREWVKKTDFPLSFSATFEQKRYTAPVAESETEVTHTNAVTTAISNDFVNKQNQSQENLDNITRLIMITRFGVTQDGDSNLPDELFINGDFTNTESVGHLILEAAVRSNISLIEDPPNGVPLFGNVDFLNAFSIGLRATENPEAALAEIELTTGPTPLLQGLTAIANATTPEELAAAQAFVIAEIESTQDVLEREIQKQQALIDALEAEAASAAPDSPESMLALLDRSSKRTVDHWDGGYTAIFLSNEVLTASTAFTASGGQASGTLVNGLNQTFALAGTLSEDGNLFLTPDMSDIASTAVTIEARVKENLTLEGQFWEGDQQVLVTGFRQSQMNQGITRFDGSYIVSLLQNDHPYGTAEWVIEKGKVAGELTTVTQETYPIVGQALLDGQLVLNAMVDHLENAWMGSGQIERDGSLQGVFFVVDGSGTFEGQAEIQMDIQDLELQLAMVKDPSSDIVAAASAKNNGVIIVYKNDTTDAVSVKEILIQTPTGEAGTLQLGAANLPSTMEIQEMQYVFSNFRSNRMDVTLIQPDGTTVEAPELPFNTLATARLVAQADTTDEMSYLQTASAIVNASMCAFRYEPEILESEAFSLISFGCNSLLVHGLEQTSTDNLRTLSKEIDFAAEGIVEMLDVFTDTVSEETTTTTNTTAEPTTTTVVSNTPTNALSSSPGCGVFTTASLCGGTNTPVVPVGIFSLNGSTASVTNSSTTTTTIPVVQTTSTTTTTSGAGASALGSATTSTSSTTSTSTTTTSSSSTSSTTSTTTSSTTSSTTSTTTSSTSSSTSSTTTSTTSSTTLPNYSIQFSPAQTITSLNVRSVGLALSNGSTSNSYYLTLADTSSHSFVISGTLSQATTTFTVDLSSFSNDSITASFYQVADPLVGSTITTTVTQHYPGDLEISLTNPITLSNSNSVVLAITNAVQDATYSFSLADTSDLTTNVTGSGTLTLGTTNLYLDVSSAFKEGTVTAVTTITYFSASMQIVSTTSFQSISDEMALELRFLTAID